MNANAIIQKLEFNNDVIGAAINDGILYLYNDKLLYMINATNGELVQNLFVIDNYRGFYTSNNIRYMQTDVELSAVKPNGSILSHLHLNFRTIAFGCLLS